MIAISTVLVLAASAGASAAGSGQVEDCVAAVVNGKIITLVDLKITARFGLAGTEGSPSPASILEEIVNRKLVIDFTRGQTVVQKDELEIAMNDLRSRMGQEAWSRGLAEFGLDETDLKTYLGESLLFRKVIAARFSQNFPVTISEIETYYRDVFVPAQRKAGIEPPPMVQALDRIEALLQEEKKAKQIVVWIANLRRQADIQIYEDCLK